jgi:predicted transcriptional regulator
MAAVAIDLDGNLKVRLDRLANARALTSDGLLREAIAQYVEREEKRDAFRAETLEAWQDHQRQAHRVDAEAVDRWLVDLEQGKDAEPPACS